MGQLKDLTGQKFGKLTVLRRAEDRKRGRPMWLCQCECGNQTVVSSTRLLLPNGTRSCGCLRHQPSNNLVDLTGKVFGHLTVLRRDESVTGGKAKWICRCTCGNTVSVFSSSLRSGKTKSCGCRSAPLKHDLTGQEFGYLLVLGRVYNPKIKKQRGALEMPLPELRAYRSGEQLLAQDQRPLWSLQMHPVPQT